MKSIVLGGGCFWCLEAIFQRIAGVDSVVSGYAGGFVSDPDYRSVCSDVTGHAEVIQVSYDESVISLSNLLDIFFAMHDPTTLNQQGADRGSQYRSVIYFSEDDDVTSIDQSITEQQQHWRKPIVTEVKPLDTFYPAEQAHQNFYDQHQGAPYCELVINPKLSKLMQTFADKLK